MADQPAKPNDIVDWQSSSLRTKTKTIRSQKIAAASPPPTDSGFASVSSKQTSAAPSGPSTVRSHAAGHLASKISTSRRKTSTSELASQQRAITAASPFPATPSASSDLSPNGPPPLRLRNTSAKEDGRPSEQRSSSASGGTQDGGVRNRPAAMRSTSAIASRSGLTSGSTVNSASSLERIMNGVPRSSTANQRASSTSTVRRTPPPNYTAFPPLASPPISGPDVPQAPSSGMYWSRAPVSGQKHPSLRAHTTTIIGSNIYVFGGCDSRACFNDLYVLDADAFHWSRPYMFGDIPVPLRAMTCTAVGKKLVIFGGGDGPAYYNDVYVLDTVNFRWSKPRILGDRVPSKRRAHTACLYKNGIYVFGGGDGVRALNDIWRLDVNDLTKLSWKLISSPAEGCSGALSSGKDLRPKARGYHTANIVDGKLIIFGGSDGGECFNDVWVFDIEAYLWKAAPILGTFRRLSHTATIVGSYLFVIGGHDGNEYSNDVLLLNLVQMTWDKRKVYGLPPSGRGYHGTVLHDSRLLMIGGFDGGEVFGDVWILEMAVHAYYSQISHFQIDV